MQWLTMHVSQIIFNHMVESDDASPACNLDQVFHALADSTRRAMLAELRQRDRCVGELAAPHRISLAAASKHIKTLERAGLIKRTINGRVHLCALDAASLADAYGWLSEYADGGIERVDAGASHSEALPEVANAASSTQWHEDRSA